MHLGGILKLIVQPEDGIVPLLTAIKRAEKSVDMVIFRFDLTEIEKALKGAVARGVVVRTLVANTNAGGEKRLRKLEQRLLDGGVTVVRTADDLVRYHGKLMIVDRSQLYVLGFNHTHLDIEKSRSFGVIIKNRPLVLEAIKLFEADATRQACSPDLLVVSPENARQRLAAFLKKARRQLLIYDPQLTDNAMIKLLEDRAKKGVEVKVLGKVEKRPHKLLVAEKYPGKRLHVRVIVRDGRRAFVGSQSLRKLELDQRREVGVILREQKIVKQIQSVFEEDWGRTRQGKREAKKLEKGKKKDKKKRKNK